MNYYEDWGIPQKVINTNNKDNIDQIAQPIVIGQSIVDQDSIIKDNINNNSIDYRELTENEKILSNKVRSLT